MGTKDYSLSGEPRNGNISAIPFISNASSCSTGTKLGWITPKGIVYNVKGEKVASIKKFELLDPKGKKLGTLDKDGTFYNPSGVVVFTIEPNSKGEKCKVFDPQGKVIDTVQEKVTRIKLALFIVFTKKCPRINRLNVATIDLFQKSPLCRH